MFLMWRYEIPAHSLKVAGSILCRGRRRKSLESEPEPDGTGEELEFCLLTFLRLYI